MDTDLENGGESGGDGGDGDAEYISGMDSLNEEAVTEAGGKVTMSATAGIYVDIALMSSDYNWDQATEAKVRRLSDSLQRMPTTEEITKAIEE